MTAEASCTGKVRHETRAAAVDIMRRQRERARRPGARHRADGLGNMDAYRCGVCGGWHVGSKRWKMPDRPVGRLPGGAVRP